MEKYKDHWEKGVYKCSKCGHPLFSSDDKFNSIDRWPSFRDELPSATDKKADFKLIIPRTELICKKCHEHLGHVFNDGKEAGDKDPKAGKHYCILSDALEFDKAK